MPIFIRTSQYSIFFIQNVVVIVFFYFVQFLFSNFSIFYFVIVIFFLCNFSVLFSFRQRAISLLVVHYLVLPSLSKELTYLNTLTLGARSFSAAAPKLWNELPLELLQATSLNSFKSRLKTYLFKKYFYSLYSHGNVFSFSFKHMIVKHY